MNRAVLLAVLIALPSAAPAAPGGPLGFLPQGRYACETGGDATGAAGLAHPEMDFTITRGSSYRTAKGKGIYLFTGDRLVFTSGPFEGLKIRRVRENFLRFSKADGSDGDMRCVRRPGSHG
ncbi:hypothetical protein H7F51_04865 [Novosphingobium flavum]|uniref:Elongation factor P n=1 Tax=Novosphingobium flavum TaxID=1778672 RepID=A0A7X1KL06_9SPHN|nr:hypothetical protein [Novosphingobium flavum]MBC2664843.1 hypothetical protein [Novosphingobium flavum]